MSYTPTTIPGITPFTGFIFMYTTSYEACHSCNDSFPRHRYTHPYSPAKPIGCFKQDTIPVAKG